jgi:hypothetical protein
MSRNELAIHKAAGRFAFLLARLTGLVVALRLTVVVAGPLIAAAAASLLFIVAGVRWWARFEARLSAPVRPPTQLARRQTAVRDEDRHLAFAQALTAVAVRYLVECEWETWS